MLFGLMLFAGVLVGLLVTGVSTGEAALTGESAVGESGVRVDPLGPVQTQTSVDAQEVAGRAAVKVVSRSCHGTTRGTGVLVDVNGQTALVTNHHVVKGGYSVVAELVDDGSAQPASLVVVASDAGRDLALAVPSPNLEGLAGARWSQGVPVLTLGNRRPELGDPLVISGFPGGRELAVVEASAQLSVPGVSYGFDGDVTLVNGAAVPGMSGGPIVDGGGDLVAIVAAVDETTGLVVGVPADEVGDLFDRIDINGRPPAAEAVSGTC